MKWDLLIVHPVDQGHDKLRLGRNGVAVTVAIHHIQRIQMILAAGAELNDLGIVASFRWFYPNLKFITDITRCTHLQWLWSALLHEADPLLISQRVLCPIINDCELGGAIIWNRSDILTYLSS